MPHVRFITEPSGLISGEILIAGICIWLLSEFVVCASSVSIVILAEKWKDGWKIGQSGRKERMKEEMMDSF